MTTTTTHTKVDQLMKTVRLVLDAIRDSPTGIPAGHLYAMLMAKGITLQGYTQLEDFILRTKLVTKRGDLLTWSA